MSHTSYACNSGPICTSPNFKCSEPLTPAYCPVYMCKREREIICKDESAGTDCSTSTALGVRGFPLYVNSVNALELFPCLSFPRGETGIIVTCHYKTPICAIYKALKLLLTT